MPIDSNLLGMLIQARQNQAANAQATSAPAVIGRGLGNVADLLGTFGKNVGEANKQEQAQQAANVAAQTAGIKTVADLAPIFKAAGITTSPQSAQDVIRGLAVAPPAPAASFSQKALAGAPPLTTPPGPDLSKLVVGAKPVKDEHSVYIDKPAREVFRQSGFKESEIPAEGEITDKAVFDSVVKLAEGRRQANALVQAANARGKNEKLEWLKTAQPEISVLTNKIAESNKNTTLGLAPTFVPTDEDQALIRFYAQFLSEVGQTIRGTPTADRVALPAVPAPRKTFPGLTVKKKG